MWRELLDVLHSLIVVVRVDDLLEVVAPKLSECRQEALCGPRQSNANSVVATRALTGTKLAVKHRFLVTFRDLDIELFVAWRKESPSVGVEESRRSLIGPVELRALLVWTISIPTFAPTFVSSPALAQVFAIVVKVSKPFIPLIPVWSAVHDDEATARRTGPSTRKGRSALERQH